MGKVTSLSEIPSAHKYLQRIGAEVRSFRSAVILKKGKKGGYDVDKAVINFAPDGEVSCYPEYAPTEEEQTAIRADFGGVTFPELKPINKLINLPKRLKEANEEDIFEFRDRDGNLLMIHLRFQNKDGSKNFVPFTYWDDDVWRPIEAGGKLPLYGLDTIEGYDTVFIHEGCKSARKIREMVEGTSDDAKRALANHPWGEALSGCAHLGWIGGAPSPYRTDWSVLRKMGIRRAYIVSDHDITGVQAVQKISEELNCITMHVQFTDEWPAAFDLGDDFPSSMFKEIDAQRHYVGPDFLDCIHPATWATDQIFINGRDKKPIHKLRDHIRDVWAYVNDIDMYVCKEAPDIIWTEKQLGKYLKKFSHSGSNAMDLIEKDYNGTHTSVCYRPDKRARMVTHSGKASINLHVPSRVRAADSGSPEPFLEFMAYLVPDEAERRHMLRWCATLIARPANRMEWGPLMISEEQGIGKTTLGASILSPLVGGNNVSYPSEADICESQFNSWLAQKRLIVINEIYQGQSWKVYNRMKSLMTEDEVDINQKFMKPYRIQNWAHIFACSNSSIALRMSDEDRRWFVPSLTHQKWPRQRFVKLFEWLAAGGLSVIRLWAERFGDYVLKGEAAPHSQKKQELVEDSYSYHITEARKLADALAYYNGPAALLLGPCVNYIKALSSERMFEKPREVARNMKIQGNEVTEKPVQIGRFKDQVIMNRHLVSKLQGIDDNQARITEIGDAVLSPAAVAGDTI